MTVGVAGAARMDDDEEARPDAYCRAGHQWPAPRGNPSDVMTALVAAIQVFSMKSIEARSGVPM
jgi:hypothetical protein